MAHNTQNHWVFGLSLSYGILETRKQNVSETGEKTSTHLGPLETAILLLMSAFCKEVQ
jgi:hypothetical protein